MFFCRGMKIGGESNAADDAVKSRRRRRHKLQTTSLKVVVVDSFPEEEHFCGETSDADDGADDEQVEDSLEMIQAEDDEVDLRSWCLEVEDSVRIFGP